MSESEERSQVKSSRIRRREGRKEIAGDGVGVSRPCVVCLVFGRARVNVNISAPVDRRWSTMRERKRKRKRDYTFNRSYALGNSTTRRRAPRALRVGVMLAGWLGLLVMLDGDAWALGRLERCGVVFISDGDVVLRLPGL